jgi:non-specific serine/threonine protein kinase
MGLGKTLQTLALLLWLKRESAAHAPALLVAPASLLANWKDEARRFAPSLRLLVVHPSGNADPLLLKRCEADPASALAGVDLVVTSYGMAARTDWLADAAWRLAILDEAQAVKNPGTRQAQAVKRLQASARLALTGTPVENRLGDLWSLFDFINPGLLGGAKSFDAFVRAREGQPDAYAPVRRLTRPYILRRLKTDRSVIADLPDKTVMPAYCGLSKAQAELYAGQVRQLKQALDEGEADEPMKRRALILTSLMRFKQICNHPAQALGDGDFAESRSGKFARLRALAEEIAERQDKALVFTQYREMTEPLAAFLAGIFRRQGLVLHGGTPVSRRRELVEAFQRDDGPPFFVLSLKAGGTGLNLTQASHVIHFDRWWNPAVENQATDRAFRIGQKRNVLVHTFVCRGTVEDKISALLEDKRALADDILQGGGEALLTEMKDDELLSFVALDLRAAAD